MKNILQILILLIISTMITEARLSKKAKINALNYKDKLYTTLKQIGIDKEPVVSKTEIVDNTYVIVVTIEKNIFTIIADKKSVKNLTLLIKEDSTKAPTQDVASTSLAAVSSFINPYMVEEGRAEILKKLGFDTNGSTLIQQLFDINGYQVETKMINNVGYAVKIDRVMKKKQQHILEHNDSCRAFLFVNPIYYNKSKFSKKSVRYYIKNYAKEQYGKLEINDTETLKMIEEENIKAFNRLVHVGNKELLQKVIDKYCAINMCDYVALKEMYEEEFEAASNK